MTGAVRENASQSQENSAPDGTLRRGRDVRSSSVMYNTSKYAVHARVRAPLAPGLRTGLLSISGGSASCSAVLAGTCRSNDRLVPGVGIAVPGDR